MKREISGTSVVTAVLLVAAAVLLCARLQGLNGDDLRLPLAAALLLEAAFYGGIVYVWCGRINVVAQALGIAALLATRIFISAAATIASQLDAAQRPQLHATVLSPVWQSWLTAGAFAVLSLHIVRGAFLPGKAAPGPAGREASEVAAVKVAFDSTPAPRPAAAASGDEGDATSSDESLFKLIEPQRRRPAAATLPIAIVDGWVSVPASVVEQQLPPGAQVRAEEILVPLALVMPRLREGEVRVPLNELDDISVPISAAESATSVELPLRLIVPQIPEQALELPETQPPAWLSVDAALEEIYFARV